MSSLLQVERKEDRDSDTDDYDESESIDVLPPNTKSEDIKSVVSDTTCNGAPVENFRESSWDGADQCSRGVVAWNPPSTVESSVESSLRSIALRLLDPSVDGSELCSLDFAAGANSILRGTSFYAGREKPLQGNSQRINQTFTGMARGYIRIAGPEKSLHQRMVTQNTSLLKLRGLLSY